MSFFKEIVGEGAVTVERGVFRQVKVYERDGYLYVATNSGYARVMADGSTSKGLLQIDFMTLPDDLQLAQRLGRLCIEGTRGASPLAPSAATKLLGTHEAEATVPPDHHP